MLLRSMLMLALFLGWLPLAALAQESAPLNLRDRATLAPQLPLLIAHRGGVVNEANPECSPAAIRSAAEAGFDMVELDVQESSDQIPIVFHDRTLLDACGAPGAVSEHTAAELTAITFLANGDHLQTLDSAFALCKELGLGVMIDCKRGESMDFFDAIRAVVVKHGMGNATVCINGDARIRMALKGEALLRLSEREWDSLKNGGHPPLSERFWFGLPRDLEILQFEILKRKGVLVFPGINTFRYDHDTHQEEAAKDIAQMLEWGVDGLQIDAIYQPHFEKMATSATKSHDN